jgi:uncharacterized protein YjbI with pentapeptide repeats
MKTLTQFLDLSLDQQRLATTQHQAEDNALTSDSIFIVMENETLTAQDYRGLTISGSLLSLTTFQNCSFESCVFFGTTFENCNFIGCKFENCSFEFSHFSHSNFSACEIANCNWQAGSIRKTKWTYCIIDSNCLKSLKDYDLQTSNCMNLTPDQGPTQEELGTAGETLAFQMEIKGLEEEDMDYTSVEIEWDEDETKVA